MVTGFPEFPNTSPSRKLANSDDPVPRKSQNFSKKRHPRNVGGDTHHPETSQRSNRGAFMELPPPLAPINRWLPLLEIFHRSLAFLQTVVFTFAEKRLAASNFPRTFLRYYSLCPLTLVSTFHHTGVLCFANFIHERRLYCLLFVRPSNRWLELKVLQDP
jgi:hypothetical protein